MEGCATAMILTAVIYPVKLASTFSLYYRQLSLWYLVRALISFICPLSEWTLLIILINKYHFNHISKLKLENFKQDESECGVEPGVCCTAGNYSSFLMSHHTDLSQL